MTKTTSGKSTVFVLLMLCSMIAAIVQEAERFGLFKGISSFNGLSKDTTVGHKGRCSTRCVLNFD